MFIWFGKECLLWNHYESYGQWYDPETFAKHLFDCLTKPDFRWVPKKTTLIMFLRDIVLRTIINFRTLLHPVFLYISDFFLLINQVHVGLHKSSSFMTICSSQLQFSLPLLLSTIRQPTFPFLNPVFVSTSKLRLFLLSLR